MTKRFTYVLIAIASVFALVQPASADEMYRVYRHHHRHHRHYQRIVLETDIIDRACYTGWWQTLRFGHVRPRWDTYCRR